MTDQISEQAKNKKRGNPNWRKGVSANPGGRPKSDVSLTALLKAELSKHPIINGQPSKHTWAELLIQAWLHGALKQHALLKEALDRIEGKIPETINADLTSGGEKLGGYDIRVPEQTIRDAVTILTAARTPASPN